MSVSSWYSSFQILNFEFLQRFTHIIQIVCKTFFQNILPQIVDSEFRIPVTVSWVLRGDVSYPIPFCACEMNHQHTDRIHIRPRTPIEGGWRKSIERLKNIVMMFLQKIYIIYEECFHGSSILSTQLIISAAKSIVIMADTSIHTSVCHRHRDNWAKYRM